MDTKTLTVGDLQTTDTLDACKKLCDDKPLCKAYQYNSINKEKQCLTVDLKTGDIKTSDAVVLGNAAIRETTCYVVPKPAAAAATFKTETGACVDSLNKAIPDTAFTIKAEAKTLDTCKAACSGDTCKGYSFNVAT